jgi:hypothetical protein
MIAFRNELPCGPLSDDPTPDEIARRAAKIRSKWSEAELMRRRATAPKDRRPPTSETTALPEDPSSIQANS